MTTTALPIPAGLLAISKRTLITAQVSAIVIMAGVIASEWGNWTRIALVIAIGIVESILQFVITLPVKRAIGHERSEDVRAVLSTICHVGLGILCDWSFAVWFFIPFGTSIVTAPPTTNAGRRVMLMLAVTDLIAVATGADWHDIIAFTGIATFIHLMTTAYLGLADKLLHEHNLMYQAVVSARQAAQAQEQLASIGLLAAGVAHEINNPMCFVTANIEDLLAELRAEPALPARLVEFRDEILPETADGITRVNSIVADLRRFARKGEAPAVTEIELSPEIVAAVRIAKTQLAAGQRITANIEPGLRTRGRSRELGQVLLNLIINAIESSPESGEIRVDARTREQAIELIVADDGIGMSAETRAKLFQPFFTTKPPGKGVGLGLAVVHGIVTSHGGEVVVESELGRGSTFTIRLPKMTA